MTTALATKQSGFDLAPQTFEQAIQFSKYMAASDLVPKDYRNKPENCFIAMQWGAEIGLKPMQALQNIAAINGRPALWGDAMIALVRSSPLCEYIIETDDGQTATCRLKRRGEEEQSRTFSIADAERAGLARKQGPWTTNPRRMRQLRARAFALRDVFPDVLRGIPMAEEVMDIPADGHAPATPVAPVVQKPEHYPEADFAKNVGAWAEQLEREAAEKAAWLRVLAPSPQPYHNTQVRDVESFTERQRKRMKIAGWFKQRGESALDVLLAIAIGAALAAVLFFGWSN